MALQGSAREETKPEPAIRPADAVLSRTNGSAVYPTPLSFSRGLVRKMLRQGWRTRKLRTDLDELGRGEAHYRVEAGDHVFDFLAISNVFPQEQKVDRSFGVNWDISAAICEGEWTASREADLRVNIPLQRAGRFDHGVLAFARGNRSERIFDQVVDFLARGEQPDATELAGVGYVFRTTGFHSNGAVGMRPYAGIPQDHPLRPSYHAQILLALLMRDFVFDLVDHLARVKGGDAAAALDTELKRYLGIGNSAGLGLIPYLSNHSLLIRQWTLTCERARAEALDRVPGPAAAGQFLELLGRAIEYFTEDPRDGNDIFTACAVIAEGLQAEARAIEPQLASGRSWAELLSKSPLCGNAEVRTVLESIVLECYPDIVARYEGAFEGSEQLSIEPEMSLSTLRERLDVTYGWLLNRGRPVATEGHYFWYAPQEAPNEPRRGRRGVVPEVELENRMDAPLRAIQLAEKLAGEDGSWSVAEFLAANPEFRSFVSLLQALDDEYAIFRDNALAEDFVPFPSMRYILAFYGMEKLDPRLPRSVKGAFLQGAPLLADIEAGRDGIWPFPLFPRNLASALKRKDKAQLVPLRLVETPEASAASLVRQQAIIRAEASTCRMSSSEIFRATVKALQTEGLDLGAAEFAASAVVHSHALGLDGVGLAVRLIEEGRAGAHGPLSVAAGDGGYRIAARQDRPLAVLPVLLDHAGLALHRSEGGTGWAVADGIGASSMLLAPVACFAARKHGAALLTWAADDGAPWAAIAWGGAGHSGIIAGKLADPAALSPVGLPLPRNVTGAVALVCGARRAGLSVESLGGAFDEIVVALSPDEAGEGETAFHQAGVSIEAGLSRRLLDLANRALVSGEVEQRIR